MVCSVANEEEETGAAVLCGAIAVVMEPFVVSVGVVASDETIL